MSSFIFDVDGTLTDSRQRIDPEFEKFMTEFTSVHTCYICTGSDRDKTVEQLGTELTNKFKLAFHCSGNSIYEQDNEIYKSDWQLSNEEKHFLIQQLKKSSFPKKTGNHLETRTGTANFSIVGRNADDSQRKLYVDWDTKYDERDYIAYNFNKLFGTKSQAVVGGDTGIDIFQLGKDKSQILEHINTVNTTHFFGDKMYEGGNDFTLGVAIGSLVRGNVYSITNWQHTYSILQNFMP